MSIDYRFTGKAFTTETEFVLQKSETRRFGEYNVTFETLAYAESAGMQSTSAALSLHHNGTHVGTLLPERRYYKAFDQGTTEVSIYSGILEDFYLILVGWSEDGSAKFQIYINPLVNFVWFGSFILIFGSIWAMWPTGRDKRIAKVEEQAKTAAFLLSDDSSYITGQSIRVDGGVTRHI